MYNHAPENYECPFCSFAGGLESEYNKQGDVIFETDEVLAYTSPKWWVNNPGNVMLIPKMHVENVYDISDELLGKVYAVGKQVALAMKSEYGCDGVSFRQHNESAGNQEVWHFHLHVFPRWEGDDLYINHRNTRYVEESERAPYAEKLRNYFQQHTL